MVSVRLPVLIALLAFGCSSSDRIPKEETRSQLALAAIDAGVRKVASDATGDLAHAGEIAAEVARIQTYLDSRYTANDIWRTFETKLGQTIDCIDWFAQPSVRALAAAGTPVTKIPTPVMPSKGLDAKTQYMPDWGFDGASDKNGVPRACPPETAPFVRVTVDEILAAGGLEYYLIRHSKSMPDDSEYSDTYTHDRMRFNHSNAQIYYGVGTLQIDSPTLRSFNQDLVRSFGSHSISQLWMMRGNADYDSTCPSSTPYRDRTTHNCTSSNWTQTVEAGWEINAGSSRSLFFIFTTNDGYRCGCWPRYSSCSTPCANTPQPFVYNAGNIWPVDGSWLPVNPDPVHGWVVSELANVSIYNSNGTWHVIVGGVDVGYYPNNWFSGSMRTTATEFRIGGEVYDTTGLWIVPMGSGASATYSQQAAYIHDTYACASNTGCVGDMVPMDTINGGLGQRGVYNHSTSNPYPGYWGNAFFFGNAPGVFWNANYGYDAWNPVGYDWAPWMWKGECGYKSFPQGGMGVPMTGISENAFNDPLHIGHAVLCSSAPVETAGTSCYALQYNSQNCTSNLDDWDPGYSKAECGCGEYVIGVSQDSSGIQSVLCCPGQYKRNYGNFPKLSMSQSNCKIEEFFNGDSVDFGPNSPQWDPFYYKGQCPTGYYVAGVSSVSGALHRLLCCDMSDEL